MTFIVGTPHTHNAGDYWCGNANGQIERDDIQTCKHCQAVVYLRKWQQEGGWCARCQSVLCNNSLCMEKTAKFGCVTFIEQLEKNFEGEHKLAQFIKSAGLEPPVPQQPIFTG